MNASAACSLAFVMVVGCSATKKHPDRPACAIADKRCERSWFIEEFRRHEQPPIKESVEPSPSLCAFGNKECWANAYRPFAFNKDQAIVDLSVGCPAKDEICFATLIDALDIEEHRLAAYGVSIPEFDRRVVPSLPTSQPVDTHDAKEAGKALDDVLKVLNNQTSK